MSKKWEDCPNKFRYLDNFYNEFKKDQEKKLNADHNWQPSNSNEPPINNEYAIPIDQLI
jgi:hypothetical protein